MEGVRRAGDAAAAGVGEDLAEVEVDILDSETEIFEDAHDGVNGA